MKQIELLSPVGDFECLKAAIQNGADAVYLGASCFSARASAKNFNLEQLEQAITYARLRNVDVHLALNTLIKNEELNEAIALAKTAYELGVSAIIVQDYGLASALLANLPDLPIHASTQMSIHNLEGVEQMEKQGFSRVVLSRELHIPEIEFIRSRTNIELETFIHGAICISYSGQCLLSSMIGGRSGNRGRCAQACRLPYELVQDSNQKICSLDKGYLLSPRDLCGLDYIPSLLELGINSLKIEGRMKTPEYVATVTRIYRKYIDLALSDTPYIVEDQDKHDLLQVFNRGGFSNGHLEETPNRELIYPTKPNNMGIYIGNVANYNPNKGHIAVNLNHEVSIGDTISLEHETSKYHVSELMIHQKNIETGLDGQIVKMGRMKGNIKPGDKIYKLESKRLSNFAKSTYTSCESIKTKLGITLTLKENTPICAELYGPFLTPIRYVSDITPTKAINNPITKDRILTQFAKTGNTAFSFENLTIDLDDNLYLNISDLNELRRNLIQKAEEEILKMTKRTLKKPIPTYSFKEVPKKSKEKQIALLLNKLDINANYSQLSFVNRIYLPLKYFARSEYANLIKNISTSFDTYIYMPTIIKANYRNLFTTHIDTALQEYDIKGFVLSNIGTISMLENYKDNYEFIGNYTLNTVNTVTLDAYQQLGLHTVTLSPELNKTDIQTICNTSKVKTEYIVYGNLPVMTCRYCFLGKSNKCYPDCSSLCKNEQKQYYLKDRLGLLFKIVSDNIQTITTIYNSKITSIASKDLAVDSVRIDILDENILEINHIIETVKSGMRLDGKEYTNGNFNRNI